MLANFQRLKYSCWKIAFMYICTYTHAYLPPPDHIKRNACIYIHTCVHINIHHSFVPKMLKYHFSGRSGSTTRFGMNARLAELAASTFVVKCKPQNIIIYLGTGWLKSFCARNEKILFLARNKFFYSI